VLVSWGTPVAAPALAAAPPPASVAPADRCFTATITPTTIPMPTTPGTATITIVCHASPSAALLSLDDSEAEGREAVRGAVADIDWVAVIDNDREDVVDGEIVLLRVAVSIDRVTVIVCVSDQVTLVLLERSDDSESDCVGPEVDICALVLSESDGERNSVRDAEAFALLENESDKDAVPLAVIENNAVRDPDTLALVEIERDADIVRDADTITLPLAVIENNAVRDPDTLALVEIERDADIVRDADTITLLENESDKDDVRECVSVPLGVTDKEFVGDRDAVPLAEVDGDNVDVSDSDAVSLIETESEGETVCVSDSVSLAENENDDVCDADNVRDDDDDCDTEAVLLVEWSDVTVSARVRVKGMITYSPGTPTFDDVGHVVRSDGSKYVPVGPTYPPNLVRVDTSVFTRNNIIVRSLFHRMIVCTLMLPVLT
jgi:hypothetical protein